MVTLSYKENSTLGKISFVRIGDLSYFEGPLLTLFEDLGTGHLYAFDWVDRDTKVNRWLIYRVTPESLFKFINRTASHFELFRSNPDQRFYVTEINNQLITSDYVLQELERVPLEYYPNEDNYFDLEDSRFINRIQAVIYRERLKQENEYPPIKIDFFDTSQIKSKIKNKIQSLNISTKSKISTPLKLSEFPIENTISSNKLEENDISYIDSNNNFRFTSKKYDRIYA